MNWLGRVWLLSLILSLGFGADLAVPPNLKAGDVPPIPAEIAARAARYAEFRSASLLDWHPQKREMLIATRFGDATQVHRVAFPGGARTQLTFFREPVTTARYSRVDGNSFVFSKDVGGSEKFQIYRFDRGTSEYTMLTDGVSRNLNPHWSPDGNWVAFTSTKRTGRDNDIWVVKPGGAQTSRLLWEVKGGGWNVQDWSPDGQKLLVGEFRSATESALHLLDIATGHHVQLTPEQKGVSYSGRFAKDGKGLYLITSQDSDFERLAYLDLGSKAVRVLTPKLDWNVEGFEQSSDGRYLAYRVNENGRGTLHVLDVATGEEIALPELPAGSVLNLKWRPGSAEIGFTVSSAKAPADVYSLDLGSRRVDRWTESETGSISTANLCEPEVIRWKSFDGLEISGLYYRPVERFTGKRPVIISIHGGPESQTRPGFLGLSNYYLSELGVALIYPNVRGSDGYGKKYLNLDNGEKREDSVKDIGALLDWIAKQPDLDASRVMVTGGSYGGYMTLASMTHYNDRIRCAVDVVGISNWVSFLERTEGYRRDLRRVEYGDERDPKMRDFLSTISPRNNARKITKPMMIVAGRNDPRVPYTEGEDMVKTIRGNGGSVWYLLAEDEGHGFAKKTNRDFQFAATVLFVQRYLLN